MMDEKVLKGWCRGKDRGTGEMVEGTPFYHKDGRVQIFDYKPADSWIKTDGAWHFVISDSVQMFSGILDKNEKKVFEGDRVMCRAPKCDEGTVVFENGVFSIKLDNSVYGKIVLGYVEDLEVIQEKKKTKHDVKLEEISTMYNCPYEDVEFVHGFMDDYLLTQYVVGHAKKHNVDVKELSSKLKSWAIGVVLGL